MTENSKPVRIVMRSVADGKNRTFLDNLSQKKSQERVFDFPLSRYIKKYKNETTHFSRSGIKQKIHTEDSDFYYISKKYAKRLDGLNSRNLEENQIHSIGKSDMALLGAKRKYSYFRTRCLEAFDNWVKVVSPVKMWNFSLVCAIIFGMLSMTMIYRYLGGSVSAKIQEDQTIALAEVRKEPLVEDLNDDVDISYITNLLKDYEANEEIGFKRKEMEDEIMAMVEGYPIEAMVPEIIKRDRMIAALLVAIARKESAWGKRVPVLNGEDCFNYWGYRGIRKRMGSGGHTCFDSPKDAVDTVAKRIETLVNREGLNTPAKMVVWKCGYDCSWDNKTAIQKWISDVDYYYKQLNK